MKKQANKINTEGKILAVILNWNELETTLRCIDNLEKQKKVSVDILVVDNGSLLNPSSILFNRYPKIKFIRNSQNLGVPGGRNIGIRLAIERNYKFVLLFDNDAYADKNMVKNLLTASIKYTNADIFGPKILIHGKKDIIWRAGCTSWKWTYLHSGYEVARRLSGLLHKPLPLFLDTDRGSYQQDKGQYDEESEVSFQIGCAQLIRTKLFGKIGLLDEDFSPYGSEDIDFCARTTRAGKKIYYVPRAVCWHKDKKSSKDDFNHHYHNAKNILLLARKNLSPFYFWCLFLPDYLFLTFPLMILESTLLKNPKKTVSILKALKWNLLDCKKRGVLIGNIKKPSIY